jgi:hypothetical protein
MTVLTFPSNPTNGQRYAAPNGIQYVFDGVKWIVETTTSSSEAISNSTQDRVAPMFVNGTHDGITFSYDAATNVMSAEVTAVNGNRLVNGNQEVVLGSNGTLTVADDIKLPATGRIVKDCGNSGTTTSFRWINIPTTQEVQLFRAYTGDPDLPGDLERGRISVEWQAPEISGVGIVAFDRTEGATQVANRWSFKGNGDLQLPVGGDIVDSTGTSVLGGSGDRLVNGSNEAILNSDGSITFPTLSTINWEDTTLTGPTLQMGNDPTVNETVITGPTPTNDYSSASRVVIQGQQGFGGENNNKGEGGDVYIWAGSGGDAGSLSPRGDGGDVKLRGGFGGLNGGYIRLESGDAQAENGTGGFLDLNAGNALNTGGYGGHVNIRAGNGSGDGAVTGGTVGIYTNNGFGDWKFKPDGSFALNSNEVHIATNNWGRTAFADTSTVIYTAKVSNLASIRVHATIEGVEDGDTTGNHTQACDMMIVRRVANGGISTVDSVVYGVIYTGAGPLATLDAQWNATTSKIEITATPISTTNNVYVKIYATEVARGD